MFFDKLTYKVSGVYLPAMINGDHSGLEPSDEVALAAFLESLPTDGVVFDTVSDEEGGFEECDICGLMANCYTLIVLVRNPATEAAIAEYCDRTDAPADAVSAFVEYFGLSDIENFEDAYCGEFRYQSDVDTYLVETFLEGLTIPKAVEGYLDEDAIARDMRYDHTVIESGSACYLLRNW